MTLFRRSRRRPYALKVPNDLDRGEAAELISEFLRDHERYIIDCRTDIPPMRVFEAPEHVMRAVDHLRSLINPPGPIDDYLEVPKILRENVADWKAFVLVAPYAYDASAWGAGGIEVQIADEGQSVVTYLYDGSELLDYLRQRFELRQLR